MNKEDKILRFVFFVFLMLILIGFVFTVIKSFKIEYFFVGRFRYYVFYFANLLLFLFLIFTTYRSGSLFYLITGVCGVIVELACMLKYIFTVDYSAQSILYHDYYGNIFHYIGLERLYLILFGNNELGFSVIGGLYVYVIFLYYKLIRSVLMKRERI